MAPRKAAATLEDVRREVQDSRKEIGDSLTSFRELIEEKMANDRKEIERAHRRLDRHDEVFPLKADVIDLVATKRVFATSSKTLKAIVAIVFGLGLAIGAAAAVYRFTAALAPAPSSLVRP